MICTRYAKKSSCIWEIGSTGWTRLDEPPPKLVFFGQDVSLEDHNPTEKRRDGTDRVTSVGSVFAFLEGLASDKHMNAIWDLGPDVNAKGGDPEDTSRNTTLRGGESAEIWCKV